MSDEIFQVEVVDDSSRDERTLGFFLSRKGAYDALEKFAQEQTEEYEYDDDEALQWYLKRSMIHDPPHMSGATLVEVLQLKDTCWEAIVSTCIVRP